MCTACLDTVVLLSVHHCEQASWKRDRFKGNRFIAWFDDVPTIHDLMEAQKHAGYHPAGYGGPWIVHEDICDGAVMVVFECSDNCD